MNHYEFDGERYRRFSKMQKEIGTKLIEELELKGDEKILDLGCGDGVLTYHLSKLVPNGKVIGIDASYGMIRIAKEYESKNLIFLLLDINNISFYEEFDVIFSNAALHWVKDHEKLLQNCYKALKKEGYIRFNFACHGNCHNFIEVVKMTMNSNRFKKYFSQFDWPWYMPEIYEYKNNNNDFPKMDISTLSSREKEILFELSKGLSNALIASKLFISENTVKTHVSNILSKLNLRNRTEAALVIKYIDEDS